MTPQAPNGATPHHVPGSGRPPVLPDGLVVFVKRDCPTCEAVVPVIAQLRATGAPVTVYTQDDPTFPETAAHVVDDTDLTVSYLHGIEAVPTLVLVHGGVETRRAVGWDRQIWADLTGQDGLGPDLPPFRPGCGSLSVDPSRADELAVRFGGSDLRSRRIELAALEDPHEALFDRGWSDGLPLVPPTEARVLRMLAGTTRRPDDVVAVVPPDLVECTVEKVAVNAVMAGCLPEYLPVVLAAVEGVCTDEFNMHGVLATTMPVGPVLVVNGPIRHAIGMNAGLNCLGHGNRANATIGRAVQLVIRNVGGGAPGGVDRATHGHPGKLGFCFAEDEEGSPWSSLAEERGFGAGVSTVTAFCGEGPRVVVDQLSRTPESLTRLLAETLLGTISTRMAVLMDAMLVISPEHAARFRDAGWTKARFRAELSAHLVMDSHLVAQGAGGIAEGVHPAFVGGPIPKFRDGGLQIVHAGGPAGLFSSIIGGWLSGPSGSEPVTVEIRP